MHAFEYASPKSTEQAVALLGKSWNDAQVLAGGTDLLSLMKDDVVAPKRVVNLKGVEELRGIQFDALTACASARSPPRTRSPANAERPQATYPSLHAAWTACSADRRSAAWARSAATCASGRAAGTTGAASACWARRRAGESMVVDGDNRYHAILGNDGTRVLREPVEPGSRPRRAGRHRPVAGPKGTREVPVEKFFRDAEDAATSASTTSRPARSSRRCGCRRPPVAAPTYEVREREALDWPLATASVALRMNGNTRAGRRESCSATWRRSPGRRPEAEAALAGKAISGAVAQAAGDAAVSKARALSGNGYKVQLARVAVKRAVLAAAGGGAR